MKVSRVIRLLLALAAIVVCLHVPGATARRTVSSSTMSPRDLDNPGPANGVTGTTRCTGSQGVPTMYYSFEVADLVVNALNNVVTVTPHSSMGDYTAKIGYSAEAFYQ